MVDRFLSWIGVGVLAAGLSAGVLAGAGLAAATEGATSDGAGASTSSNPDAKKQDSAHTSDDSKASAAGDKKGDPADPTDATPRKDAKDDDVKDVPKNNDVKDVPKDDALKDDSVKDTDLKDEVEDTEGETGPPQIKTGGGGHGKGAEPTVDLKVVKDTTPDQLNKPPVGKQTKLADTISLSKVDPVESKTTDDQTAGQHAVMRIPQQPTTPDEPDTSAVAFAAPAVAAIDATAASPQIPGIIRVIGTLVFNLYGFAIQMFGGPPISNSPNVTVRSSSLHLDCGCNNGQGVDVQADWYVPKTAPDAPAPTRLIYLQHGFLAAGPWYSFTATALAEQTHSIVVAPSITSNFFAADACWLGAPTMHEAMARLFDADNTALADSAAAAGYLGPIPDRVVLIGHSLGGGAVIGIAGAMADNGTEDRLAGVIMLDGVPFDPKAAESIAKVDPAIPIYNLAAPRYLWNEFGVGTDALLTARPEPGRFIGVTLVGGSHVDSMTGGNPLIQFSQQLVAGFSEPQNVEAAKILMIGWAQDMFDTLGPTDPDHHGIYPDPADPTAPIQIGTAAGTATAVPLPNSLTKPYIFNFLRPFMSLGSGIFNLQPECVQESMGVCSASTAA